MSIQMKLVIPLLDNKLKLEHLSEKAGFINAYSWNKNKPYLDNHIFLMYNHDIHNVWTELRDMHLTALDSYYGKDYITHKGKNYVIYIFVIVNSDVKNNLLKGLRHSKLSSWKRIAEFWNYSDDTVNEYLAGICTPLSCHDEGVPEADYFLTDTDIEDKSSEGLIIDSPSFLFSVFIYLYD